jgi:hypothetical protein
MDTRERHLDLAEGLPKRGRNFELLGEVARRIVRRLRPKGSALDAHIAVPVRPEVSLRGAVRQCGGNDTHGIRPSGRE